MPGGSPGLSPRFSPAYSVVNPCIVVLARRAVDNEAIVLEYGVTDTIHGEHSCPCQNCKRAMGLLRESPKLKRLFNQLWRSAGSGISPGQSSEEDFFFSDRNPSGKVVFHTTSVLRHY